MDFKLHFHSSYDMSLAPVPAERNRTWFEDNKKTADHARHCLPLAMANSLGYYILSPGTFGVSWDGNTQSQAIITHHEKSSHYEVDNHAIFGGFVVQAKFIPVTEKPGDFIYFKSIPNERDMAFTCMEAMIEAWWSVANFGLVFMLHQAGEFIVHKGQPIAHMLLYKGIAGAYEYKSVAGFPPGHVEWAKKRNRPDYKKDLDYFKGKYVNGTSEPTHLTNWKQADKYGLE